MFRVFENTHNSVDRPPHRSVHNGVLITHDDLSDDNLSRKAPSLYVKPLAPDHSTVKSSFDPPRLESTRDEHRLPQPERNAQLVLNSLPSTTSKRTPIPIGTDKKSSRTLLIEYDSHKNGTSAPSLAKINRSSFKRNTSARRSLGGMATLPSWLETNEFGDSSPINLSPTYPSAESPSHLVNSGSPSQLDFSPLLQIRVTQLPSLDSLGFALDSYSDPASGHFVGLRLCERFRSRQFYFDSRENCPFQVGDVIMTINQYKLANTHESQAIRYVFNAFRDARQYTVEFGVYRPPDNFDGSSDFTVKKVYEPSTLPNRSSSSKRFSAMFLPSATITDSTLNQHQPRRSTSSVPTHSPYILDVHGTRTELHQKSVESITQPSNSRSGTPSTGSPLRCKPEVTFSDEVGANMHPQLPDSAPEQKQSFGRRSLRGPLSPDPLDAHQRTLSGRTAKDVNAFNTRAIGQKIPIELVKLAKVGLGFTLTSRDTKTSSQTNEPVYVKKILSTGAAISDGRLLVGDRLLTVNGVEVENLDHALSRLRSISPGRTVQLVVSRQSTVANDNRSSDRKSTRKPPVDREELPMPPFRSLTFEFYLPSLEDSRGKPPQLGINFKWALQPPGYDTCAEIPGLYVDSLLPDGLITQYERKTLLPGDRLVGLNGENLEGQSAKEIASRIKQVLSGSASEVPSSFVEDRNARRRFSLTIHRYLGLEHDSSSSRSPYIIRSSTVYEEPEDEFGSSPANHFTWSDSRRRRRSRAEQGLEVPGESNKARFPFSPPGLLGNPHFQREGIGRRSVSEKRHGHMDATQYSFFQTNVLPNRYKMPEEVDKQYSTMPTARRLKLHKERMAAAATAGTGGPVKALHSPDALSEDWLPAVPPKLKSEKRSSSHRDDERTSLEQEQSHLRRGRKQNSSFRNAVDRSLTLTSSQDDPVPHQLQPTNSSITPNHRSNVGGTDKLQSFPSSRTNTDMHREAHPPPSVPLRNIPAPVFPPGTDDTPPVPTRRSAQYPVDSPEPRKPSKRAFGSFKGLFRRSGKRSAHITPATQVNSPTSPGPVSTSVLRRLSVPESRLSTPDDRRPGKNHPLPKNPPTCSTNHRPHSVLDPGHTPAQKELNQITETGKQRGRHSHARHVGASPVNSKSNGYPPHTTDPMQKVVEWRETVYIPPQPAPPVPPRVHRTSQPKKVRSPREVPNYVSPHAPIYRPETLYPQIPTTRVPSSTRASRSSSKQSVPQLRDHSPVYVPKQPTRPASAATLQPMIRLRHSEPTRSGQVHSSTSAHRRPTHPSPSLTPGGPKFSPKIDNTHKIYANGGMSQAVACSRENPQSAARESLYTNSQPHLLTNVTSPTSSRAVPLPYRVHARKSGQATQHRRS